MKLLFRIFFFVIIIFIIGLIGIVAVYWPSDKISEADFTTEIVDLTYFRDISDRIIFQSNMTGNNQIYSIKPSGDDLIRITENEFSDEYPVYSPDRSKIAFFRRIDRTSNIFVLDMESGEEKAVTEGNNRFLHPSFMNENIIGFDCERTNQIYMSNILNPDIMQFTDLGGRTILPNFSPDGRYMAITRSPVLGWNVYVMNLEDKNLIKLTDGHGACRPHFHKNSKTIAYVSGEGDGKGEIWKIDIDGSNKKRITNLPETYDYYPSFSPCGRYIVYARVLHSKDTGDWNLWIITSDGRRTAQLTSFPSQEKFPCWSR